MPITNRGITGGANLADAGALINSATEKTTPVDADYVGLMDSAASNILKKLSWANIKATLFGGDIPLTGTGKRLTADLTSTPIANRLILKTSTTNGVSILPIIPNGSGVVSGFEANSLTDPDNCSQLRMQINNGTQVAQIRSGLRGTGVYFPIVLMTSDVDVMTLGVNGLVQFNLGYGILGKVFASNGATTTYTYPAATNYVYITTTAVSLQTTLPAAAAAINGLVITLCPSASVATATWVSSGATFVGAPAALVANTPVRMIYHHATTQWTPY